MRAWGVAALLWSLTCSPARAEDAAAREQFEIGVAAAEENRWSDAVAHLEASLARGDRAATRYNLVLAHERLGHPLEVVRHGLAFLAMPEEAERSEARAKVQQLLAQAKAQIAALDTDALAAGSVLFVDGAPPLAREGALVYVAPGVHRIELRVPRQAPDVSERELMAGEVLRLVPLPALLPTARAPADATLPHEEPAARAGKLTLDDFTGPAPVRPWAALAIASVGTGALVASVACLGLSYARAERLHERGVEGTQREGYLDASERYQRSLDAVIPLALVGGGLLGVAVWLGEGVVRRGNLISATVGLMAATALFAAGGYLLAHHPAPVVATTDLQRPSRQLGGLLVGAGLPLATYGSAFLVRRKRNARVQVTLAGALVTW